MKNILLIFFIVFSLNGRTQSFFEGDTTFNVKRTAWTSGVIGAGWVSSTIALQAVWYKEHWSPFHFFDDSKEWLGMDKFGHSYTSYSIAKNLTSIYRWAGVDKNKSLLIGSSVAFGFQATIEVLDGFSNQWGFSWSDLGANTLGVAWFAWQDLVWQEQRLKLKFSSHLTPYAKYRPNTLGSTFAERLLKDYNGQTYWLSISPGQFMGEDSSFPKWLSFSFGYSVDEKLHGDLNEYSLANDAGDMVSFQAKSQFIFSLDIDFEQFNPKRKWVSALFKAINHVKIPFPALVVTGNKVGFNAFYF